MMRKGCEATYTVETEDGETLDLRCTREEHENGPHRTVIWWSKD